MTQVYLNGEFVSQEDAKISPMDRGFLFGDGIYEVIPCYWQASEPKTVGLSLHLKRMNNGLEETGIKYQADEKQWAEIINHLAQQLPESDVGIYIHVSRGTDVKRFHAYPDNVEPTVFAYAFAIPPSQPLDRDIAKTYTVSTAQDLRWQRCHIKSTSLLGNVMHFQQGQDAGKDEMILFDKNGYITEAAACNVFVIKDRVIYTPPVDNHLLPGVTRGIIIESLKRAGGFDVREQGVPISMLESCDEVWITSSSKEIGPVVAIDDRILGDGKPGELWLNAQRAYNDFKFLV
ncbi:aminotransferase class IV [Ningiella sp. W23]|uniref:aminotransferase class IV n=1 Tax=Ningiella sp. W23 TaxID=3023715 RepID=UPI003757AB0C